MVSKVHEIKSRPFHSNGNSFSQKHWLDAKPFQTHFFNTLSLIFPVGEKFFIHSIKEHQSQINDLVLSEQIKGFIQQEANHHSEHTKFNQKLEESGYHIEPFVAVFNKGLDISRKKRSKAIRLGFTVACEHLTAAISECVLEDERWLKGASTNDQRIWYWHAIEEVEHKAVAFDVYQVVDGSYFRRCLAMLEIGIFFPLYFGIIMLALLYQDKSIFKVGVWYQGLLFLWLKPAVIPRLTLKFLAFFSPRFHPWKSYDLKTFHLAKDKYESSLSQ